jgi:hypothetical protein
MAISTPSYATRDVVKRALDVGATARADAQIDRLIQAGSRQIEGICNRVFYPTVATRYFDWPTNYSGSQGRPWQIWLDANELISVTSVVGGTTTLPSGDVYLEPINSGPPYNRVEVRLSSSSSFFGGLTWQRAVAISGLFGYRNDEVTVGTLTATATSAQTTVSVSDSSQISAGALIRVDTERMLVGDSTMTATGVTLTGSLTASAADNLLEVGASISTFVVGETILLDAERMLITDVSGTKLVVKRAYDGSVLAVHTAAGISALRLLTVTRGFLGTTAASHSSAAAISRHMVPALVEQVNVALAVYGLGSEQGGMRAIPTTPMSTGEAKQGKRTASPITSLLEDLEATYGRKMRTRVI